MTESTLHPLSHRDLFALVRWNPTRSCFLLSLSCPPTRTWSSLSWGSRRQGERDGREQAEARGTQRVAAQGWEVCEFSPTLSSQPTEHHAAVGRHVPERAQEPSPTVPTKAGGADADARFLEPNAQPLPTGGHSACWRAAGLGCAVPGASDDDGLAHPGGEQVSWAPWLSQPQPQGSTRP